MLTNLKTVLSTLRRDETGATAIEYGLIAAGISVVIIGAVNLLGGRLLLVFQGLVGQI